MNEATEFDLFCRIAPENKLFTKANQTLLNEMIRIGMIARETTTKWIPDFPTTVHWFVERHKSLQRGMNLSGS